MAIKGFKLKSGVTLQVDTASFEVAIELVEAVKRASIGMDSAKDIGEAVGTDPGVRRAVVAAFPWVLYGTDKMTLELLNDPNKGLRVRGDYFEIMNHIIEVNMRPFFPGTSSGSPPPEEAA